MSRQPASCAALLRAAAERITQPCGHCDAGLTTACTCPPWDYLRGPLAEWLLNEAFVVDEVEAGTASTDAIASFGPCFDVARAVLGEAS